MNTILERYERYSYAEKQFGATDAEPQDNWSLEFAKLTAKIEVLQRNIRHYAGEELDHLNLRELQSLEQQLDTALKRIRTRQNQLMHESISELQKKEKALQGHNNQLAKNLKEKEKTKAEREQLEQQNRGQSSSTFILPQPQPQPPPPFPSLTIGTGTFQVTGDGAQAPPCNTSLMPPWMLRHVNR